MKCPSCQGELKGIDYRGILIDECEDCKGRWFDNDELRKAKDKTDDDLRWLDFDPFGEEADKYKTPYEGKVCPRCSVKMVSLTYQDSGVIIDKCNNCQGVWLNRGEFEKVVDYLEEIVVTEPLSDYIRDTEKQFWEIFTGPEGRISEIKDFLAILKLLEMRIAVENPKLAEKWQKIYRYSPLK